MESLPVLPLYIGFVIVLTLASMLLGKWLFIFYALYIDPTSFTSDFSSDTPDKPEIVRDKRIKSAGDSGRSAGTLTTTLVAIIYFVRTMWCRT